MNPGIQGYVDTGRRCQVCQASYFGKYISPPSLAGFQIPIPGPVTCSSGPAIVYHLRCTSGRPECSKAHYTGEVSTTKRLNPMSLRWSNHKSHHKHRKNHCAMTEHLIACHPEESAQDLIKITILDACPDQGTAKERETIWAFKLFSFYPSGLNIREEPTHIFTQPHHRWDWVSKLLSQCPSLCVIYPSK